MKVSPLIRAAVIVGDLERSDRFYREAIGFDQVFWEGELAGASLEALLAVPAGSKARARILKSGDVEIGMVGLFELTPATARTGDRDGIARAGNCVLVFYCSDLDEACPRIEQLGGEIVCAPLPLVHEGRVKQREMTCRDPDGVAINLIEWDPAAPVKPELS